MQQTENVSEPRIRLMGGWWRQWCRHPAGDCTIDSTKSYSIGSGYILFDAEDQGQPIQMKIPGAWIPILGINHISRVTVQNMASYWTWPVRVELFFLRRFITGIPPWKANKIYHHYDKVWELAAGMGHGNMFLNVREGRSPMITCMSIKTRHTYDWHYQSTRSEKDLVPIGIPMMTTWKSSIRSVLVGPGGHRLSLSFRKNPSWSLFPE